MSSDATGSSRVSFRLFGSWGITPSRPAGGYRVGTRRSLVAVVGERADESGSGLPDLGLVIDDQVRAPEVTGVDIAGPPSSSSPISSPVTILTIHREAMASALIPRTIAVNSEKTAWRRRRRYAVSYHDTQSEG